MGTHLNVIDHVRRQHLFSDERGPQRLSGPHVVEQVHPALGEQQAVVVPHLITIIVQAHGAGACLGQR